ncbi:MAG: tyrosine-type recombinase/integrase [Desulfobacteraceae bacterium]|jgi:integrase
MVKRRSRGEGSVYLRGKTWWIQYRADGKVYNESAKTDKKTEAIELLKKRVGEIAQGRKPSITFEKTTFKDLKDLYLNGFESRGKRDKERAELAIKHLEGSFKGYRAIDITEKAIEEYNRKRMEIVKPTTVNRELSVLCTMFNLGIRYKMVSADRAPFIQMNPKSEPREGFIDREKYNKLYKAVPDWLKPVLKFAFQTGWRKEEILGLEWKCIDMQERQITLPSRMSKNGYSRPIYADDIVYRILKDQQFKQFRDGARTFPFVHRMRSTTGNRKKK